jgi:hypothetical protein
VSRCEGPPVVITVVAMLVHRIYGGLTIAGLCLAGRLHWDCYRCSSAVCRVPRTHIIQTASSMRRSNGLLLLLLCYHGGHLNLWWCYYCRPAFGYLGACTVVLHVVLLCVVEAMPLQGARTDTVALCCAGVLCWRAVLACCAGVRAGVTC